MMFDRCAGAGRQSRMPAHRYLIAAGMILTLSLTSCGSEQAASSHVIEISGFAFVPDTLSVSVGDTIVWVNRDVVPHTATAGAGQWDSGPFASDSSWTHVVGESGEMPYTCTLHPSMTGLIVAR